jgi:ATP-dependent Clp protease adaptor protein ClpS
MSAPRAAVPVPLTFPPLVRPPLVRPPLVRSPVLLQPALVAPSETLPVETKPTELEPVGTPETGEWRQTDRPWLVIVWNDPINLMSFVTFVLQKLFGYSKEKATKLMLDVHHKGRAVVASGTRERAELDVYRLHEHGLWATMEQST